MLVEYEERMAKEQETEEKDCKEWQWEDMPDRWNDFRCYHGWQYFLFVYFISLICILICCFFFSMGDREGFVTVGCW